MLQTLIDIQRDIYTAFADHIRAFADDGSWLAFTGFLPMAVVFGAVHALTPGHSKAVLATYLAGSRLDLMRGLMVSFVLSLTHVMIAVLIALLALPLVSISFGSVGRAPALEGFSRGLIGLIGAWMIWRSVRRNTPPETPEKGMVFGLAAGLIPCPLTLFVMTFAITQGVVHAGVAFAAMMVIGVGLTLAGVALTTVFFRQRIVALMRQRPDFMERAQRSLEAGTGVILLILATLTLTKPDF